MLQFFLAKFSEVLLHQKKTEIIHFRPNSQGVDPPPPSSASSEDR
jgi:hypothetical protein